MAKNVNRVYTGKMSRDMRPIPAGKQWESDWDTKFYKQSVADKEVVRVGKKKGGGKKC